MKATLLFLSALCVLLFSSCSGSGSGTPGPIGGITPDEILRSCDNVITSEKVAAFNASQNDFQVQPTGGTVRCEASVTVNGSTQKVQVKGFTNLSVLPRFKFLALETDPNGTGYLLKLSVEPLTDSQALTLITKMGLSLNNQAPMSFIQDTKLAPSYVRFGKGELFFPSQTQYVKTEDGQQFHLQLMKNTDQALRLNDLVRQFKNGESALELIWYPQDNVLSLLTLDPKVIAWRTETDTVVLISVVRDSTNSYTKSARYIFVAEQVYYWKTKAARIHKAIPEIYDYALDSWESPTFADNTTTNLVHLLRYIVGVNPNSDKKQILDAYEIVSRANDSQAESMRIAFDYVNGKTYTKDQFDIISKIVDVIYSEIGGKSWKFATLISARTQFSAAQSVFVARVATLMKKNRLNSFSDTDVEPVFRKIAGGISESNVDFYFSTLSYFREKLNASSSDAESACDQLILTGRMTVQNSNLYFDVFLFLKDQAYLGFVDALAIVNSLSSEGSLDSYRVSLFKSVYNWLKNTVYLSSSDALQKAGAFVGKSHFNDSAFNQFKNYFSWLVNSIYLGRSDALTKAENTVITKSTNSEQIENIKSLTDWYINTIYMNRTDSLARAEKLILVNNLNTVQVGIMKDLINWLVNTIYVNRTDAAAKGETYVTGSKPMDQARADQLKDLVNWYINSIYMNRTDALLRSENLVVIAAYERSSTDVMKGATDWLVNTVFISRSDAATKAAGYLTKKALTAELFTSLKSVYDSYIKQNKSRDEALRLAEAQVLL